MKQIAVMAGLLIAPFLVAKAVGADGYWAGQLGLAIVFLFAAIGHFIKTDAMAGMLPPSLPKRRALIQISGFFEAAIAVSLLAWPKSPLVGFVIIAFLVAIFPSNIYAAMKRIDFGGHSAGPRYLLVRAPLQLLLIFWTYWFVLRGRA